MVLENDYMIHNVTFSLSLTIKRISTTNSFPYGPLVWRNPTDKRLTVLEKLLLHRCVFFFLAWGWGGVGVFGILVPPPGIEPGPPIVGVQSPNHRTTREFPTQDSYPYTTWTAEGAIWVPFYLFWFKGYLVLNFWKILSSLDSCFAMDSNSSSCASPEKSSTLLLWQQE